MNREELNNLGIDGETKAIRLIKSGKYSDEDSRKIIRFYLGLEK